MATEKYQTYVTATALKAALLFVGDDVRRQHIQGVCIEHSPKGARLIATDEHRMIIINLGEGADGEAKAVETIRYTVDEDIAASAAKLYGKSTAIAFTYERDHSPDPTRPGVTVISAARVTVGGISTEDKADKFGKYPDYARVIPAEVSGKLAHFNTAFLQDCTKARALLTGKTANGLNSTFIAHNGDSAGLVHLSPDAFAIVMPMRGDAESSPPDWYTGKAKEEEAKAA